MADAQAGGSPGGRKREERPLKILHTTTSFLRGGGAESNIFQTICGLRREFEFHLVCGPEFEVDPFADCPEVRIEICANLTKRIDPLRSLLALGYFYRLIRRERYDIVHTHEAKDGLIVRIAAFLAGCPCIIYGLHGVYFNDPMPAWKRRAFILLERGTMRLADLIISVSHDALAIYQRQGIGRGLPSRVVRSGIDMGTFAKQAARFAGRGAELRARHGLPADALVLLNVGRFSPSKGQRFTIRAFAGIRDKFPGARLVLVGTGPQLPDCRRLAAELGVEREVLFAGFREDVTEFLAMADLFLFSSLREGLPRVVVESCLMRVPVVAFAVEGLGEIVADGVNGSIVPPYDIEALRDRACRLLGDPQLRAAFGVRGYERVRREWDLERMLCALRQIYRRKGSASWGD